jgi:hypothetical protein
MGQPRKQAKLGHFGHNYQRNFGNPFGY